MKLHLNCIVCDVAQVAKAADMVGADPETREIMMKEALAYLEKEDFSKNNPEIMGQVWRRMTKYFPKEDLYEDIKAYYNRALLQMEPQMREQIEQSADPFDTALKMAILGNLIDFAMAGHAFDIESLKRSFEDMGRLRLAVDDGKSLYNELSKAGSLLYLGDNCGEICFDKIFIDTIRKAFPQLSVYYGVKGKAVVNDVTREDARMVRMDEVATVLDNGDDSLGTEMSRVKEEFRKAFYDADVVIAKGQGNFESLHEIGRNNIFYLLMAKCEVIAEVLGLEKGSVVCLRN